MAEDIKFLKQIKYLSNEDLLRISFSFDKKRGKIIKFSLQYESLIENKRHIILRVDNSHPELLPHKHIFHKNGKEAKLFWNNEPDSVFNEQQKFIIDNFLKIKENYLFVS